MQHLREPPPASTEEFLVWSESREEKYEFVDGVVVMQARASRDHERVAKRIFASLLRQVDAREFDVNKGNFGVRIQPGSAPGSILLPDVVVDLQSGDGKERETTTPLVVVEVLSPSADLAHHVRKLHKYAQLGSLAHYAVFSHFEPEVHIWRKKQGTWPMEAEVARGLEATVDFPEIGATLELSDVYTRPESGA